MADYDKTKLYKQNLIDNGYFTTRGSLDFDTVLYQGAENLAYPWNVSSSDKFDATNVYYDPSRNQGIVPGATGMISPKISVSGTHTVAMTYTYPVEASFGEGESVTDQIMYIRISGVSNGLA